MSAKRSRCAMRARGGRAPQGPLQARSGDGLAANVGRRPLTPLDGSERSMLVRPRWPRPFGCLGRLLRHAEGLVKPLVSGGPGHVPRHVRPFLRFYKCWVLVAEVACVLWVEDDVVRRAANEEPHLFGVRMGDVVWIRAVASATSRLRHVSKGILSKMSLLRMPTPRGFRMACLPYGCLAPMRARARPVAGRNRCRGTSCCKSVARVVAGEARLAAVPSVGEIAPRPAPLGAAEYGQHFLWHLPDGGVWRCFNVYAPPSAGEAAAFAIARTCLALRTLRLPTIVWRCQRRLGGPPVGGDLPAGGGLPRTWVGVAARWRAYLHGGSGAAPHRLFFLQPSGHGVAVCAGHWWSVPVQGTTALPFWEARARPSARLGGR